VCLTIGDTVTVVLEPTNAGTWQPVHLAGTAATLTSLSASTANSPRFRLTAVGTGTATATTGVSHPGGQGAGSARWTLTIIVE
jgi:hypothetical protein